MGAVGEGATVMAALDVSVDRIRLRARPSSELPRQAREAVAEACDRWGLPRLRPAASLVVSELVTNAVRHSQGPVTLEARVWGRSLQLRVWDASPAPPAPRATIPPGPSERGRGLAIVAHFSRDWGWIIDDDERGKVVWATVSSG
jgi:anti-sigma regulatory factor (Ser/Thr protein kinase)